MGNSFYGWRLLFFLWIVYTLPIGFALYSPAVLYPAIIDDLGWTRGRVMVGSTAIMMLFGLASPLAAWLIGRVGPRLTILAGSFITALSAFIMGRVGHIYPLYIVLSLGIGLGVCLSSMIPVQTVVIAWFHVRRALALGLVLGGGAIGGFLAPQLISRVVQESGGDWRLGWYIIALASLAGAVVALLGIRNHPDDLGQDPDGLPAHAASKMTLSTDPHHGPYRTTKVWTLREAMRTRPFWFLIMAVASSFFLWQIVVTQGPLHLQDRGFEPEMSSFFYSLALGLSIVGRLAVAALGDRIEPRYLFAIGAFCIFSGGILFWNISPKAVWTAYLYPLLAGFGFGATYICIPIITGNYWGVEVFAKISGVISPMVILVQGGAAPIAGFVYDLYGSYLPVMSVAWILSLAGFMAILFCLPPRSFNQY